MIKLALSRAAIGALLAVSIPTGSLSAQKLADPQALIQLQSVLQAAKAEVAPSLVRIETFGGNRKMLAGGGGRGDGAARPKPKKKPKPKSKPKDDDKKDGEKDKKKKRGPLVMPGFLQAQGATTGVILSEDGWILISRFAVNFNPSTILVTLADGRSFNAERGGEDTSRGLALVKIEAEGLHVPDFVDPATIEVGSWAFALGRTFGQKDPTVHMGIVSATERLFGRALQIDAYTSPANYGGAVIDVRGRVMGISVPLSPSGRDAGVDWYDSGIGFATTIADIPDILERMRDGETLHRAFLGINYDANDLGPGVKIEVVRPDSPAMAAGVEKGDRILSVDGTTVRNTFHLQMLISSKMAGDPLQIEFRKSGDDAETRGITVFLAEVPRAERKETTKKDEVFTPPWHGDEPPPEEGGGSGR